MKDWSQSGEQRIILEFFSGRTARFLDCGAHMARDNSNVRALIELGWGGVCIEPSPTVFPQLLNEVPESIDCVNCAIDDVNRVAVFYDSGGDQISTLEASHRDLWKAYGPFRKMFVYTATFRDILREFPGPFPFVNIDVEGANLRVLKSAPLVEMGCEMVCVEKQEGVVQHLTGLGFNKITQTNENILASR